MIFHTTAIADVYIIEPEPKVDERGYLARVFCKDELAKIGVMFGIAQISRTFTKNKGTIRGLHFQQAPMAEDKIIQCLKGRVYDVAVDLRDDSPTRGQWVAEELTGENQKAILLPKGFAHGFQTLTDDCEMQYLMSQFYSPPQASGVRWDDAHFNISWPIEHPALSQKDQHWPDWQS